jgi:hypothetical protein
MLVGFVGQDFAHEFDVDFQVLDREPLQIGKAGGNCSGLSNTW